MVICPKCGEDFVVRARARIGEGTRKSATMYDLTENHLNVLKILMKQNIGITARRVLSLLEENNISYKGRSDNGKWDIRIVTTRLSQLINEGTFNTVRMIRKGDIDFEIKEERFDNDTGEFIIDPAPKFIINDKEKAQRLIDTNGYLRPRPEGSKRRVSKND